MPLSTTLVSFPDGAVEEVSTVVAVQSLDGGRYGVVTERTPFHPLDHTWPDQPGDTGALGSFEAPGSLKAPASFEAPGALDEPGPFDVVDCLTAAAAPGSDELLIGEAIPVRRGDEDWTWVVLHIVGDDPADLLGTRVRLAVDATRRAALSAAHTGCHLLALALNAALADRWRKEARLDAFGSPDFDALAMASSSIGEHVSTDVYRLGKSLRKKGFTAEGLVDDLPAITRSVNTRLAGWLTADAPVRLEVDGPELTAHRKWTCVLPDGTASLSCGGTHLRHLGELASLTTSLELSENGTALTAVTTAKRT